MRVLCLFFVASTLIVCSSRRFAMRSTGNGRTIGVAALVRDPQPLTKRVRAWRRTPAAAAAGAVVGLAVSPPRRRLVRGKDAVRLASAEFYTEHSQAIARAPIGHG